MYVIYWRNRFVITNFEPSLKNFCHSFQEFISYLNHRNFVTQLKPQISQQFVVCVCCNCSFLLWKCKKRFLKIKTFLWMRLFYVKRSRPMQTFLTVKVIDIFCKNHSQYSCRICRDFSESEFYKTYMTYMYFVMQYLHHTG